MRRFFVLPVGAAFLVLLGFTLLGARVGATLYEPDFYKRHLDRQEVYVFILGDFVEAAIEELRSKPPDFFSVLLPDNPLDALNLPTPDLVRSVNGVFPADWLQEQLEGVIDQVVGYLSGDRDDLDIRVTVNERVPAAAHELKAILASSRVHALALEHYAAREVDEALAQGAAPFGARLDREDVVAAIDRSVPEAWLSEHVNAAIDQVAAYMSSRQDTLRIHVPLYERADIAIEELNALYAGASLDSGQLAEQVASELEAALPALVQMPSGVSLTAVEVAEAVEPELPGPWLEEQARVVVASAAPYIMGKTDGFIASISTVDARKPALAAVEVLVREKLEARLAALRACGRGEMPFGASAPRRNELPRCAPPGIDADALLDMLEVDVAGDVERLVGSHFPAVVEYTQDEMRLGMGGEASRSVLAMDRLRILFGEGWTYTEADLQQDWAGEEGNGLEDLRALFTDGWRLTLSDLDDLVSGEDEGVAASEGLEQVRSLPARSVGLTVVSALVLAALLAAAGLLGGRSWRGRLAWASGTLAVTSMLLLLATTLSIGPVVGNAVVDLKAEAAEDLGSPSVLLGTEKALDVAQSMGSDFITGVARSSLWFFVVGAAVFALSFAGAGRSARPRLDGSAR
ncbi:MAG: hypothetical protein OYI31_02205 [Chloroflexota bacterium]|nr:hypothetical protein [Chloroflexota bacterium]MDE2941640.1 hypothetical protein [Chloroflexota bacterium]MDE3267259.1 hypothetical protein [Chloroflexota bacterium]